MLFDTRLYVSRGVPKLREVAMEIVRPSSGFRLSQYDASGENLYVCDFIDERKQKIIKNVPELLKGISILDLKAKGEREYSINASLVWGNLGSGSDSDENIGLSEITGLPIIPQRFVSEYEEMYKKIRSEDMVLLYGFHNLYYINFPFIDSSYVKKGDVFNYIAVQGNNLPKRFKIWSLIYYNDKTNVKLYSAGGLKWTY